jgi:hypothetical protein
MKASAGFIVYHNLLGRFKEYIGSPLAAFKRRFEGGTCQIIHTPRRVVEPRSCGWGPSQGVRLCAEQIFLEESAEAENSGEKEKTQKTVTSTNLSCR